MRMDEGAGLGSNNFCEEIQTDQSKTVCLSCRWEVIVNHLRLVGEKVSSFI